MKCWTPFFVFSLLWAAAFAAYSNEELKNVVKAKGKNGVLSISDETYEKVLKGKRDYHLFVFLTSQTPQINCVLCREFTPYYDIVADSYRRTYPEGVAEDGKDVYFLVSEVSDSRTFFKVLKLDSIPKVFHYPPSTEGARANSYLTDFNSYQFYQGDHVELFSGWVTSLTGQNINIYIPPDYSRIAMNGLLTFTVVLTLRKFSSQVLAIAKSPFVWGVSSIVFILLFLAGYMFNQIRGTPFVRENGRDVEYIAPGPQMQYGLETQVISTLYGLLGLSFVILAARVSKISNPKVQFLATVIVCGGLYVLYGMFLNVFSFKYGGYPFKFFDYLGF
ncbi:hypothetical protein JCM33374_g942 [Metschnikowia sp. JCM 33374]|nr:hypothetical protein JCM33374_g942 [Metschnikowia sp. JCM 33374]